jgi:hypothetical protein
MKKLLSRMMVMISAAVLLSVFTINTSKAQGRVSLQVFYDELDPYGTWMEHRTYGYVWIPSVDRGFVPYSTNGYWVQTEYGNTWVSDYSWGWAPFHYGRWFYDDFYGWIWVPDSEWAPAWVTWRTGGGYYGWAPLTPGLSISVSANYYNTIPNHYWVFVPHRYILHRHFYRHYVPRPQVVTVYRQTTIITNNYNYGRRTTFFTGPSRREIERTNRERVEVYSVNDRSRPGRTEIERGRVSVYRPEVDDSRESRQRSVPARIARDERSNSGRDAERREAPAERRATDFRRQRDNADQVDQRRTTEQLRRAPENNREINRPSERTNANESERRQQVERTQQVQREQNARQEIERVQRSQQIEREQNRERVEREQRNSRQEVDRVQREQTQQRQQINREQQLNRESQRNVEQRRQPRQQEVQRSNPRPQVQRVPNNNVQRSNQQQRPVRNDSRSNERRRN